MALVCVTSLVAACHVNPDEPLDTPRADPGRGAAAATADVDADPDGDLGQGSGELPAELATVSALLRARHVDDLPSAAQLDAYPSAEASLRHLAVHGESMLVRGRALALLRHFRSEPTGALLASIIADPGNHAALRAAAVTGIAGQPLDQHPDRRALVIAALRDEDARVGVAAVHVLEQFDTGSEALRSMATAQDLTPQVRAAIDAATRE